MLWAVFRGSEGYAMTAKRLPVCRHCGLKFKADAYNRDHQQWCSRPECVTARDRARKRRYYRRRIERDEGFQDSERRRCREAMRRLRSSRRESGRDPPSDPSFRSSEALLVGLVSQLADTTDPLLVAQLMDSYADRGRRLAVVPVVKGFP